MGNPQARTEIIELFPIRASVPTNQRTFRTRNPHVCLVHASQKIGQLHALYGLPYGICRRSRAVDRVPEGQVWQKCGKEGHPARGWMWLEICRLIPHRATETVGARRWNAAGMPTKRKTPRCFSSARKGAGWSRTPQHAHTDKKRRRHNCADWRRLAVRSGVPM
jgi:hypothetical protein